MRGVVVNQNSGLVARASKSLMSLVSLSLVFSTLEGCKLIGTNSDTAGYGGGKFPPGGGGSDTSNCTNVPQQLEDASFARFSSGAVVQTVIRKVVRGTSTFGGHAGLFQTSESAPPPFSVPATMLQRNPMDPVPTNGYKIAFEDSQNPDVYALGANGAPTKVWQAPYFKNSNGIISYYVEGTQVGQSRPTGNEPNLVIIYPVNGACFGVKAGVDRLVPGQNTQKNPHQDDGGYSGEGGGKLLIWIGKPVQGSSAVSCQDVERSCRTLSGVNSKGAAAEQKYQQCLQRVDPKCAGGGGQVIYPSNPGQSPVPDPGQSPGQNPGGWNTNPENPGGRSTTF